MTPATHNPYLQLPVALMAALAGLFLFIQLSGSLVWAALAGGFFWLAAVLLLFVSIRRIPSWHRARRLVREYVKRTSSEFPQELRWNS